MNNLFQDNPNIMALMTNPQANNIQIPPINPQNAQNPTDTSKYIYNNNNIIYF